MENNNYVLELNNITKRFIGVTALDKVSLKLGKGEILALIGENGAGKSTLINCITGVLQPEEGEVYVDGEKVNLKNPQFAFSKGIGVVHQERNLIETFDVAENIFFDQISDKGAHLVDRKKMHKEAKAILERLKLDVDPSDSVENLSSAQKQMIEIARALSVDSKILLLDEPSASISIKETEILLDTLRDLKKQGVSIIYVSHKLEEIFAISDKIKVIRDGKDVGDEVPTEEMNIDILIEKMVGKREINDPFPSHDRSNMDTVIEAIDVKSKLNPIPKSFYLKKGEILGWYGLVGAGRTELARELIGIDPIIGGKLYVNGEKVNIRSYKQAFEKYKISYLSENRKEEGLFLAHSIFRNICIVKLNEVKNKIGFYSRNKSIELSEKFRKLLSIKLRSTEDQVSSLSGGNQQKVCIAKCLNTDPNIIVIDEPTVGIDVNTKAEIHKLIYKLSREGKSIILISSDLPELVQLAERIQVFSENKIVGEFANSKEYDEVSSLVMNYMLETS